MRIYKKHWKFWLEHLFHLKKIRYVDICPLWRCDARCPTCGAWKRNAPEINENQMYQIINHPYFKYIDQLILEGGEPTLWELLDRFVLEFNKTHPKCTIAIITNGFKPERINELMQKFDCIKEKLRWTISLNGLGKIHDASRGRKNVFDKTIESAKLLKDKGYIVTFSFAPFKYNEQDYENVVEFANNMNMYVDVCYPCDYAKFGENLKWKPASFQRLVEIGETKKKGQPFLNRWLFDYVFDHIAKKKIMPCWAGQTMAHIDPYGVIRPCHLDEKMELGRIYDEKIVLEKKNLDRFPACQYANGGLCNQCYITWSTTRSIFRLTGWRIVKSTKLFLRDIRNKLQVALRKIIKSTWLTKLFWNLNKYKEVNHIWESCNVGDREDIKFKTDPNSELQDEFKDLLNGAYNIRILDVGSGGLTVIGKKWDGHSIEIVAVDSLADKYNEIYSKHGIEQPVKPLKIDAEKLMYAGLGKFDLIHARSSLDHCYDPFSALKQMYNLLAENGSMYLIHKIKEGENANYNGLHQWNFEITDNDVWITGGGRKAKIKDILDTDVKYEVKKDRYLGDVIEVII